jgi:phospholipase C
MPSGDWSRIQHVVVLMLENRSFDNLLGWLYDPSNPAPFNQTPPSNFEGLYGKNLSNPTPSGTLVPAGKGQTATDPTPDPGEPFEDVYCQVYGQKAAPTPIPPQPPTPANMQGFIYNYASQKDVVAQKIDPTKIMNCFTPASVPVLSSLAYYYGVCDHWFASIPSQTICNRSFVHAGTSLGYVNNGGADNVIFVNNSQTIYDLLEQKNKSWKIYAGSWLITSLALLTQESVWQYYLKDSHDHFGHLEDFLADAQQPGGLPSYSFIEPVYLDSLRWGPENDMHPEANPFQLFGPSNLGEGERLLFKVYNAVRNSPDWNSTMLVVLFDEHGGCYDHVPPPTAADGCPLAVSPDGKVIPPGQTGGSGFQFDRLGVRVPAIVVSPFTESQKILNQIFDHTSIVSTVINCFDLGGTLGNRQKVAPDLSDALTLSQQRTDHPPIPQPAPSLAEGDRLLQTGNALLHAKQKPLSDLQKKILAGVAKRLAIPATAELAGLSNSLDADAFLMKQAAEAISRRL